MRSPSAGSHDGRVTETIRVGEQRGVAAVRRLPQGAWQKLAFRQSGGTLVRLYWRPSEDDVFIYVRDEPTGDDFFIEPPPGSALDAFYHPYALRPLGSTESGAEELDP
jgi:hypothetical protein